MKPVILVKENYLASIEKSVGSDLYRNVYALAGGGKRDLLENGRLSCAYFVSSILKSFDLIKTKHLTVDGTIKDMKDSGWKEVAVKAMKPGCVMLWEEKRSHTGNHRHIGFYRGGDQAISNSSQKRKIARHHLYYRGRRKIESVWFHRDLHETA